MQRNDGYHTLSEWWWKREDPTPEWDSTLLEGKQGRADAEFYMQARTDLPRALALIDEMAVVLRLVPQDHTMGCESERKGWGSVSEITKTGRPCSCHVDRVRRVLAKLEEQHGHQ